MTSLSTSDTKLLYVAMLSAWQGCACGPAVAHASVTVVGGHSKDMGLWRCRTTSRPRRRRRCAAKASGLLTERFLIVAAQNDFTPEEEEEVRRENQWAFD